MISETQKQRILEAIAANRKNYPSDAKHASALGISPSVYNGLKKGQTEKALSDANWVNIARRLDVNLRETIEWKGAQTETFKYISLQMEACQERSLSVILCDLPNIGKTYTARWYVHEHRNAVYVDCSQVKTKRALVKKIAKFNKYVEDNAIGRLGILKPSQQAQQEVLELKSPAPLKYEPKMPLPSASDRAVADI